jgi:DNA-binding transcriptional MerR regulator
MQLCGGDKTAMHAEFASRMANFGRRWRILSQLSGQNRKTPIVALLSNRNIEEAARACNIPPRTLYRWLKEPPFVAAYREARRQAYGQSIARLQQGSTAAATTLLKVMLDAATPASTKVRAAESILTHSAKAIELEDIEARVAALEQAAANWKSGR